LSAHFKVAAQAATRRAHNPYRKDFLREPLIAPKIKLETRIVSKLIRFKHKAIKVFTAWKKPTSDRSTRRSVRRTSVQAKNKADPHLAKRV